MLSLLIGPLTTLIERIFPDKSEAAKAQAEMITILREADAKMAEQKSKVVVSEAQGESWLQRNWRPLTMMFFLILLGTYWFGLAPEYLITNPSLVEHLFYLLELGIGGYIVGRSGEKIAKTVNEQRFYNSLRSSFGSLSQEQVDAFNKALQEAKK